MFFINCYYYCHRYFICSRYDSCGTIEDLGGQFHENTIVIQFDEDILEAWDQAKRLRCEWLESFEKKSSKPTLAISDLDVVELNFQGFVMKNFLLFTNFIISICYKQSLVHFARHVE